MNIRAVGMIVFVLCAGSHGSATAQTACPQGVAPGSAQCGPSGGAGVAPIAPAPPRARWVLTWGAFADDPDAAVIGTSTGKSSRRAARRAAIERCEELGGKKCTPVFDYKHQCAVAAEPIDNSSSVVPLFIGGPTIEAATKMALNECPALNDGRACEIKFSNCTKPYLVYD